MKTLLTLLLVLATLTIHSEASAQRQRRGGINLVSKVQLAGSDQVQTELKLSDDQKEKMREIADKFSDDYRDMIQNRDQGDRDAMREKMQELQKSATDEAQKLLSDEQKKRLGEIFVQANGARSLVTDEVAQALKISDEQREQLAAAMRESFQALRDASNDQDDISREERRERMDEFREELNRKLLAQLSDEQTQLFEGLKGEIIEIDRSQLRRRRR